MNLPVIDLDSSHRARTASALDAAFCDVGFCYLSNCGVDPLLVNNAFAASRRFHALETAAKAALSINAFHRGYIAPRTSTIRSSSVASV
ncbi:MAG: 2-oxoglutarate and iron-dependent oxygenase domain-containing protein, partial [Chromatiales bacterium]|nr:2-oxoglutarate and iron-dependent oxygenase domain-containing protein [Chromatiales bacterium]